MRKLALALIVVLGCGDSSGGGGGGGDGGIGGQDGGPNQDGGPGPDVKPDAGTGAPVGSPCTASSECEGGDLSPICIPESLGFPGGYCSALGCSPSEQDCPGGPGEALCIPGPMGAPMCADVCDPAAPDCREGYACVTLMSGAGVCLPANEDATVGDPCETFGDCPPGGFCLSEEISGFPGGYCIAFCDPDMPMCPDGSTCLATGMGGVCVDTCDPDAPDCRDAYACIDFGGANWCYADCSSDDQCTVAGNVCRPDGSCGEAFDPDDLGGACTPMSGCDGGFCISEDPFGFPDGYCVGPCDPEIGECPGDGVCVVLGDEWAGGTCLDGCATDADCRTGYACADFGDGTACWPTIDGGDIGQPCEGPGDCVGSFCMTETAEGWPGGYCIGFPCDAVAQDCPSGAVCIDLDDEDGSDVGVCADGCGSDTDCRTDYACRDLGTGDICFPAFDWADFGQPCAGSVDCVGGMCLDEASTGFPGGLCGYGPCSVAAADCPDGLCYAEKGSDEGVCIPACVADIDCRDGYDCAGGVWCLPGCDDDGVCTDGCCDPDAGTCGPC